MPTPTHQLIEVRLGGDLTKFVDDRLNTGMGWRRIAEAVTERTGVTVSHETLRSWFAERVA